LQTNKRYWRESYFIQYYIHIQLFGIKTTIVQHSPSIALTFIYIAYIKPTKKLYNSNFLISLTESSCTSTILSRVMITFFLHFDGHLAFRPTLTARSPKQSDLTYGRCSISPFSSQPTQSYLKKTTEQRAILTPQYTHALTDMDTRHRPAYSLISVSSFTFAHKLPKTNRLMSMKGE